MLQAICIVWQFCWLCRYDRSGNCKVWALWVGFLWHFQIRLSQWIQVVKPPAILAPVVWDLLSPMEMVIPWSWIGGNSTWQSFGPQLLQRKGVQFLGSDFFLGKLLEQLQNGWDFSLINQPFWGTPSYGNLQIVVFLSTAQVLVMCIFGLLMSQSISQVALLPPGALEQRRLWVGYGGYYVWDIMRRYLSFFLSLFGGEL